MTTYFAKLNLRPVLFIILALPMFLLLPHAAHAASLPYPIDSNMGNPPNPVPWYCHNGADNMHGDTESTCTTAELNGTQIVGEFTITDTFGHTAEAYILGNGTIGYVNSSITVYAGEPLTYSWSLDPQMIVRHWECTDTFLGFCITYGNVSYPQYYFDNDSYEPINSNFGQNSQYGTITVTAPSSGSVTPHIGGAFGVTVPHSQTNTTAPQSCGYRESTTCCPGGYTYTTYGYRGGDPTCSETVTTYTYPPIKNLSLTVVVSGSVPANPDLAISADSQNITVGQSTGIHATFAAASGDTLSQTALNEVPASGAEYTILGNSGSPVSHYDYTFTPTTPGTYIFKPYAQTNAYPSWDNEGQSVTVTVSSPSCSNGLDIASYPDCTCPGGQTQSGSSCIPNNSCTNGLDIASYPDCTCPSNQTQSGSSCVAAASCTFNGITIPSGNSVTAYQSLSVTFPDTCQSQIRTCVNGTLTGSYAYSSCAVAIPPGSISSFTATPSRVHPGGSTTLTWSTSNMAACNVTSSDTPPSTLSTALSSTGLVASNITHVEIYTLSCIDNKSASFSSQVQVKLVPVVQEL
jgi:hypothetical protein